MNGVLRSALTAPRAARLWPTPISFFHSTPALERRRSNYWHPRFNYYAKRRRKMESKKTLVRNLSEYAEYLFQSWRDEEEQNSSVHEMPWFRRHYYAHGAKKKGFREPQSENYRIKRNEAFEFCSASDDDDDDDVETMFRSFGGERLRFSYWSFNGSQNFQRSSRNWRYENYDENDVSPPHEFTSERIALGLKASGPLNLEDVKKAYRSCALKWHPDRHQGSSKLAAEEKFKHCSAAYKVLCDNLAG